MCCISERVEKKTTVEHTAVNKMLRISEPRFMIDVTHVTWPRSGYFIQASGTHFKTFIVAKTRKADRRSITSIFEYKEAANTTKFPVYTGGVFG